MGFFSREGINPSVTCTRWLLDEKVLKTNAQFSAVFIMPVHSHKGNKKPASAIAEAGW